MFVSLCVCFQQKKEPVKKQEEEEVKEIDEERTKQIYKNWKEDSEWQASCEYGGCPAPRPPPLPAECSVQEAVRVGCPIVS